MLKLNDVSIGYKDKTVLNNVTFSFSPGKVYGLMAPNGFGKSTLLKTLNGDISLLKSGLITCDDISIIDSDIYAQEVYYSPEDNSILYPTMNGKFHLELVKKIWRSEVNIDTPLKMLDALNLKSQKISKFSQGMKMQLQLAMAYVSQSPYILLDEPLNALDIQHAEYSSNLIKTLAEHGACVIISSHLPEELDRVCNSFIFIKNKTLQQVDAFKESRSLYHKLFGCSAE